MKRSGEKTFSWRICSYIELQDTKNLVSQAGFKYIPGKLVTGYKMQISGDLITCK
jgi:hypothetical protein